MWRLLEMGEEISKSDEIFTNQGWLNAGEVISGKYDGHIMGAVGWPVRRKFSQDDKEQTKNVNQQLKSSIAFIAKVANGRELPSPGGDCQECAIDALVDEAQEFIATQQADL